MSEHDGYMQESELHEILGRNFDTPWGSPHTVDDTKKKSAISQRSREIALANDRSFQHLSTTLREGDWRGVHIIFQGEMV